MADRPQTGTIRKEYGRSNDGMGAGETKSMGMSSGHTLNAGPGTIRQPARAPSPNTEGSVTRPSTGKLSI